MRKLGLFLLILAAAACIRQTVHQRSRFLDHHSFDEVWDASIKAVYDIDFTIDSLDRSSGFIGAESGTHLGQEVPPRLSIMISDVRGRVHVNCRVLQKEQFVDILGHGKRTIRAFMTALNANLNRRGRPRR